MAKICSRISIVLLWCSIALVRSTHVNTDTSYDNSALRVHFYSSSAMLFSSNIEFITSTLYATSIHTVTSCHPYVTDCRVADHSMYVTTETSSVGTTICPVTSVVKYTPTASTVWSHQSALPQEALTSTSSSIRPPERTSSNPTSSFSSSSSPWIHQETSSSQANASNLSSTVISEGSLSTTSSEPWLSHETSSVEVPTSISSLTWPHEEASSTTSSIISVSRDWQHQETMSITLQSPSTSLVGTSHVATAQESKMTVTACPSQCEVTSIIPPPMPKFDVAVGAKGMLLFEPDNIDAAIGDVIRFNFFARNHTLTQSTSSDGCTNTGEFDTGFNQFNPTNLSGKFVVDYKVKMLDPQWFYCAQTRSESHCKAGMVFSLNAGNVPGVYESLPPNPNITTPMVPNSATSNLVSPTLHSAFTGGQPWGSQTSSGVTASSTTRQPSSSSTAAGGGTFDPSSSSSQIEASALSLVLFVLVVLLFL